MIRIARAIRRILDSRAETKTLALLEAEDAILTELIKQHRLLNRQRMARIRMGAKHIGHPDYRFNGRHSKKKLEGEAYATPRSWRMAANLVEAKLPFDVMMDMLNTFEEHCKKKLEGEAYSTPRSWHMAAKPPFDVMMDLLNGTVGKGPAAEFVGFMQHAARLSPDRSAVTQEQVYATPRSWHKLPSMYMDANNLRDRYGHWGVHPDFPRADWQYEVANGDTRLGYWEWVASKL